MRESDSHLAEKVYYNIELYQKPPLNKNPRDNWIMLLHILNFRKIELTIRGHEISVRSEFTK